MQHPIPRAPEVVGSRGRTAPFATPTVGIVMVTYNSASHVREAIGSITAATSAAVLITVVDNASSDDTVAVLGGTDVRVIEAPENLGFARACNLGVRELGDPDYVLFLNPDSRLDPHSLDVAIARMAADPTIGALGGRTRYADGSLNPTCCFAKPTLWSALCYASGMASLRRRSNFFNPEMMGGWDRNDTRDVDVVTGCFLLMPLPLFRGLGGFDERFFMYSEDTDLADRIRGWGLRCVHAHDVGLVHLGGGSDVVKSEKLTKVFRARGEYYEKHWSRPRARLGVLLLSAAVLLRVLASVPRRSDARVQWFSIWRSRSTWSGAGSSGVPRGAVEAVISPSVRLTPKPFETRARIGYRVLRHVQRSVRSGDYDFVRQGLTTCVRLTWLALTDTLRRDRHECNVCGWQGPRFYPNTGPGYHEMDVTCPGCSALDRHRSLLALLAMRTGMFSGGKRVVEVAPMRGFEALLKAQPGLDYTSFDIERHAMEQGDITAMRYPSDSVDYFLCFHVLEHIPDAPAALAEMLRVVAPGGSAILQVPVDWDAPVTREYDAPDPRDVGHVRQYGQDFPEHLARAGFSVTPLSVDDALPRSVVDRFGLSSEPIFLATKPDRG